MMLLLSRSICDYYLCDLLKATTNGDPAEARTGDLSAQSPGLYHCSSLLQSSTLCAHYEDDDQTRRLLSLSKVSLGANVI